MAKKWVFNALVKSENDPIGLLAYALYKFQKDEIGQSLRAEGKSETEISERLANFHDDTLRSSSSLEQFRTKAVTIIELLGQKAGETLVKNQTDELEKKQALLKKEQAELEKNKKELQKSLNREKTKIKNDLLEQFKITVNDTPKRSGIRKFGEWLLGGFSGIVAQIIVVIFSFGLLTLFYGNNDNLIKKLSDGITASISSTPQVVTPRNT
ncbi:hypothetical protein, partial [Vibrio sp. PID17_43]|uniref:hypothetical protein n=1 Tax=Vibrio sp. PID17_43 TaxID=1583451 RepID=UPI000C000970